MINTKKLGKQVLTAGLVSATLLLGACGSMGGHHGDMHKAHWGYDGAEGPKHWGELDAKYEMCGKGKNQSPINLKGAVDKDMMPIAFNYHGMGSEIVNNGHTVQVNIDAGSSISLNGHEYALKQFHFHAPSENQINDESFPLEGHFVHADNEGHLAVIAVMFKEGAENPTMAGMWQQMPQDAGDKMMLNAKASPSSLLPDNRDYYRFTGSLTTPPCSEGVAWLVMKQPVEVSAQQVEAFSHVMHHPNNRPIQPLNGRRIYQ